MNKPGFKSTLFTAAAAAALALSPAALQAEDIDLFVSAAAATSAANPNILFVIDNTANWNSASQHWVGVNGENPFKQGQSELRALRTVVQEATDRVNIGLAFFHSGDPKGLYIRYAVRPMTATNKANLAALIGDASCVNGTNPNGTPNCIFNNFSGAEQTPTSGGDYSGAMLDVFKYFGGCTSPLYAQSGFCKTGADLSRTKFGPQRYSNAATISDTRYDLAAYTDPTRNIYNPPATTSCGKNYVVFVGNGFPNSDAPATLLSGVEGSTSQLAMPNFTTTFEDQYPNPIGTQCASGSTAAVRKTNCEAAIPQSLKDANPADSYACINERDSASCTVSPQPKLFDIDATRMFFNVQATGEFSVPTGSDIRMADEWAKFLSGTDVNSAAGVQNVTTYTLDVFKDQQDQKETALLFSMARYGGGQYFQASSEQAILKAMRNVLSEIQSLNSVFASASLPINATNRSQNENQVFIGMFRPDPGARPRWYGNLKRYQIAEFDKQFKLADASSPPQEAVATATGFVAPCAVSFWTSNTTSSDTSTAPPTDTSYWTFSDTTGHAGLCTTSGTSLFSDLPDGPQVEKGATAEVVRLGNNPSVAPTYAVNRSTLTCANTGATVTCNIAPTALHKFDSINVTQAATGAVDATQHGRIINFTRGFDVNDDNSRNGNTDVRPSVHGDVAHSRPLPVNYGGTTGVVLYYGSNDGALRAVSGTNGKELWAFFAPEHHGRLKRLLDNAPAISYPPLPLLGSTPKEYFFDGSAGLFQNVDNSKVWIFPAMRRGGRMLYAFDVTSTTTPMAPRLKWRVGCTNASLTDTASCTTGFQQMGQTWSTPAVALIKGFSSDPNTPLIVVGGGYDTCEDQDAVPNTACTATGYTRRGNRVYIINASTGAVEKEFTTNASVPADITLVDRDFDGFVDQAYVADTGGNIYRIDFVDPANPATTRVKDAWTITHIARTSGANRKFLFPPAALPASGKVYLSVASGDRERPLIINYPFVTPVTNRAYMLVDSFETTGLPVNLDDTAAMQDFTVGSTCSTPSAEASGKRGWLIDLNSGTGEQAVTSSTIFGGLVFFSTNRPDPTPAGSCNANLGKANGYALNLLNASGAADTLSICGGSRYAEFKGGGLPPSPVTGTVPVNGKQVTVMIGGVQRDGGVSSSIGAQRVSPSLTQRRARTYWYTDVDQ
jgi:type IV pilus assembly protein PilY1